MQPPLPDPVAALRSQAVAALGYGVGSDEAVAADRILRRLQEDTVSAGRPVDVVPPSPRRLRAEDALLAAIDGLRLRIHYQPIVRVTDGLVEGVEALLRYEDADGGLVGPADFLEVAEDTGVIARLDTWVLDQACRQARLWHTTLLRRHPLRVAVNVSARQLARPDLVDVVARALRAAKVQPATIVLELAESHLGEVGECLEILRDLRDLGVCLALDNFGSGDSSLSRLGRLPFQQLKIDRSLVADLDSGGPGAGRALVESVVHLGHALGMSVVGEGVENLSERDALFRIGCDSAQGWHFAHPAPPDELTRALTTPTGLPLETVLNTSP